VDSAEDVEADMSETPGTVYDPFLFDILKMFRTNECARDSRRDLLRILNEPVAVFPAAVSQVFGLIS
jgi:hypothetical protein